MGMARAYFAAIAMAVCSAGVVNAGMDVFWGAGCGTYWGSDQAAIFSLDTNTGEVGTTFVYDDWSWVMGLAHANGYLYATHNTVADGYTTKLAKIDPATGEILFDAAIAPLTGTDYPMVNTLQAKDGKLYAIENNTWGSGYSAGQQRGYVYEFELDAAGDPVAGAQGAYVGPYPDGALAYRDGTWYASNWASGTSSEILTSDDIMNGSFTAAGATEGTGYISGWDFQADGDLIGVSWYGGNFDVYDIDLVDGSMTTLFNIQSQLPGSVGQLTALTAPENVVPVPGAALLGWLGLAALGAARRRLG